MTARLRIAVAIHFTHLANYTFSNYETTDCSSTTLVHQFSFHGLRTMTLKLAFDLPQLYQFESPRWQGSVSPENSIIISTCRLSMNIRVNVVPNRTVVDSVWRFNNLCCSHLHSQIDSKNDSEEDYSTGCWNVSHCQQQSYSGLCSPRQSYSTFIWNDSCVQTFHNYSIIICTAKYACFGGQSVLHFFTASMPAFCIFKTVVLCVCCKERQVYCEVSQHEHSFQKDITFSLMF